MYLIISRNPDAPVKMSKKLCRAMGFNGRWPAFAMLSKIKGRDGYVIVPRKPSDTFRMQCLYCTSTGVGKTPAQFEFNIPSRELFLYEMGINVLSRTRILRVKPVHTPIGDVFQIVAD